MIEWQIAFEKEYLENYNILIYGDVYLSNY